MPSTPKTTPKKLNAPLTPTRVSRRIRGETPEIKVTNLTESPSKSARKRVHEQEETKSPPKSGRKKRNVAVNLFESDESTSTVLKKSTRKSKTPSPKKRNVTADMFDDSVSNALDKSDRSDKSLNESKTRSVKERNVTIDLFDDSVSTALEKSNNEETLKTPPSTNKGPVTTPSTHDSKKASPSSNKKKLTVKSNNDEIESDEDYLEGLDEEESSDDEPVTHFIRDNKSITFELSDSDDEPSLKQDGLANEFDEEDSSNNEAPLNISTQENGVKNTSIQRDVDSSDSDDSEIELDNKEKEQLNASVKRRKSVTFNLPNDKPASDKDLYEESDDEIDLNAQGDRIDLNIEDEESEVSDEDLSEGLPEDLIEEGLPEDEDMDDDDIEEDEQLAGQHYDQSGLYEDESKDDGQLTTFAKQQKHLKGAIAEFEQQNLKPRTWELAGEVAAHERERDGLLQQYIEVDYRATQAPVIDEDVDSRIESIIKKRIKDKNFDDVIRTKRVDESLQTYRARTTIDEIERKSLMQMYEDEYKKKSEAASESKENIDNSDTEEKLDAESETVQREMNAIFSKLDALSHSHYRPSEIQGEPEVIINKLALNMEEIGQKASTAPDEERLAPEEIVKRAKFAPKSKEERTKTDKLRERRHKKKKQKVIVRKLIKIKKISKKIPSMI